MSTHKPDLEPSRCDELYKKLEECWQKLVTAHNGFKQGNLTAHVAIKEAENYQSILSEYDQHCGAKRAR